MSRFSLSNRFLEISYEDFHALHKRFVALTEAAFQSACEITLEAYSQPKLYTSFCDEDIQTDIDERNARFALLGADAAIEAVTPALWREARYVGVRVAPTVSRESLPSACAWVEFKGFTPRTATYYIQPDCAQIQAGMQKSFPRMRVGDGWQSNGQRSGALPAGIGPVWGRS